MNFRDQVVWMTGASSGIGRALALALAAEGARLVLSARRGELLEEVAAGCRGRGAEALPLPLDVTAPFEVIERAAAQASARFGRIDVLILAAGISQRSFVADTGIDVYRRLMDVNYFGAIAPVLAVVGPMQARGSGRIVVISSLVGKFSTPMRSGYAASKHALHGFFDALRAELRPRGVGVSVICPGYVRTAITSNALTGDGSAYGKVDTAARRGMNADDCARRIVADLARDAEEVFVGGREVLAVYLARFFPRLFARLISRYQIQSPDTHPTPLDR